MNPSELLSVEKLTLTVTSESGERRVVEDMSFKVERNQILGLIGESGCGKSMTCLAIMGLLPGNVRKISGEIRFNGKSIGASYISRMRDLRGKAIAMILQNPMSCFDAIFTIRRHFIETLASHGLADSAAADERIRGALVEVGFENPDEILGLYPFQMSGGMLQRVMVAMAVMMDVSLLIADEPTTDLDVVSQARVLDLLENLREHHGMAILLVTHDLSVIARMADDVVVMRKGGIVESAKVEAIFQNPTHPYSQALLNAHASLYGPNLAVLNRLIM
jgi:nickel transport system ATP-binding protein